VPDYFKLIYTTIEYNIGLKRSCDRREQFGKIASRGIFRLSPVISLDDPREEGAAELDRREKVILRGRVLFMYFQIFFKRDNVTTYLIFLEEITIANPPFFLFC